MLKQNVYELLENKAQIHPDKRAISHSQFVNGRFKYPSYTFEQLNQRIEQLCKFLSQQGIKPQQKVLFFIKPDLDFAAITFALFRIGAIVVFIDPGMKKKYFFQCIKELNPEIIIGIPKAIWLSRIFFRTFHSIKLRVSSKDLIRHLPLDDNQKNSVSTYIPKEGELAAILYTSGGTGKPKGVEYTHQIFIEQTSLLQKEFHLTPDDIDIPGFPLFSFFTLCMGMTSVIPFMDPAKPATCNPAHLYKNIIDNEGSFVAGSPAIWERLAYYCEKNNLTLPSIKYLVMFGAPVEESIHNMFQKSLPNGDTFTPYGATECLPLANIKGRDLLDSFFAKTQKGAGICIGKPLAGVEVMIIDHCVEFVDQDNISILSSSEVGEIVVHAKHMTKAYYGNQDATKNSKFFYRNKLWHRMGDMGYFDQEGYLWFCGRKKHAFIYKKKNYYPVMLEQTINQLSFIKRSALVLSKKNKWPVLIIQPETKQDVDHAELSKLLEQYNLKEVIAEIHYKKMLPVDTRHNIKIDRLELSRAY